MSKPYFSTKKLNDHITLIKSITKENLYLVEGNKYAALIDTSEGVSPLKPLVDSLTSKPYIVILTHGHIDHAMGASEFSIEHIPVYLNPADKVVYDSMADSKQRKDYAKSQLHNFAKLQNYNIKLAPSEHADDNFSNLEDKQIFDLGGIHLKAFHFPGHTPGMTAILFVEDRILLTGDGANRSTFLFDKYSPSIHSYKASLKTLAHNTFKQYDHIFISHGKHEISVNLLNNLIQLCNEIIERKTDDIPFKFMEQKALIAKKMDFSSMSLARNDGIEGNIFYNPNNI